MAQGRTARGLRLLEMTTRAPATAVPLVRRLQALVLGLVLAASHSCLRRSALLRVARKVEPVRTFARRSKQGMAARDGHLRAVGVMVAAIG